MTWENSKALADAEAEVASAAEFFSWFAGEAVRTDGEYGQAPGGGSRTIVTHRPVGVAALVTPWNGREGARDGLRAFTETQYLLVGWPA